MKRVLDLAELAVPADKFERFRTPVLDEFGHKGLQNDLGVLGAEAANGADRHGMGRSETGRKGDCLRVARPPVVVEIDLPDPLPVLDEELALIEAHFADLIAAMLEAETAGPDLARCLQAQRK